VEIFAEAAQRVREATGIVTVLVTGPLYEGTVNEDRGVIVRRSMSPERFVDLMHDAELLSIGGGSSVGQAVAMRRVVVAVPLGGSDQQDRVARYAGMGLVEACRPDARELARVVEDLLADRERCRSMIERARSLRIQNGLDTALHRLSLLLAQES
jgi:UDP-N-acetylglucosamine:LPS N-acetylglucosamine transferase